jgi:hypothetical protein
MNTDVELLLRESLDRLTADARVPSGMAGRVLARRRRRRAAGYSAAIAAAAAVTAAAVLAAAGGMSGPASGHARAAAGRTTTGPALATAYVVRRVENAIANDDQVMRETQSLVAPKGGSAAFFDGQPSYESVTWAYQGRNSTEILGAHGHLQATLGTGIVDGRIRGVQVDYILHRWGFIPGYLFTGPANACSTPVFLGATGESVNWPSVIVRTLACGRYKMAGYAQIHGADTIKITGSWVLHDPATTITDTLFVNPATYLPIRITQSTTAPGLHGSLNSAGIQWLPPTAASRARASVTVPCGYQQVNSTSGKPVSGRPVSVCGLSSR